MGILSFARSTSSHEDGSPAGDEGRITHLVTSSVQTGCLTSGARTATLPRSISREYSSTMQRMPFPHCISAQLWVCVMAFPPAALEDGRASFEYCLREKFAHGVSASA